MVFVLSRAWDKKKFFKVVHEESNLRPSDSALRCSTMFFSFFSSVLFFVFFLCTFFRSYSINKHDAIDTANPSSMQDACHMNVVIDLAHRRVFVVQW